MSATPPTAMPITLTADYVQIGGFETRFLTGPEASDGAYALLEHTLAPGLLGAPPHRHAREDELSYVLEGRLAVWRAGQVTEVGPGAVVAKPRGEWHTFWNPGPVPVRFLELIAPPAFAAYFRELGEVIRAAGAPDPARIGAVAARYGLEFEFAAMGALLEEHHLRLG